MDAYFIISCLQDDPMQLFVFVYFTPFITYPSTWSLSELTRSKLLLKIPNILIMA